MTENQIGLILVLMTTYGGVQFIAFSLGRSHYRAYALCNERPFVPGTIAHLLIGIVFPGYLLGNKDLTNMACAWNRTVRFFHYWICEHRFFGKREK